LVSGATLYQKVEIFDILGAAYQHVKKFLGTFYMCTYGMLHGDQTILEGLTTPPALSKNFCDTNADTWSVCSN